MKIRIVCWFVASALTAVTGVARGHGDEPGGERLGEVNFPVSCSAAAQKPFNRAMALYHSFYWKKVTEAFDAVLAADPNCAMAHWGKAMVKMDNPFLWPLTGKALAEGLASVERAKALKPKTARERDYIAAAEQFFRDHDRKEHKQRVAAYEEAMAALARTYPDDVEARILHALALTANVDPKDKTYAKQLRAAEILEPIFRAQPQHPGVAHYLIHSYDYPSLAAKGLDAAKRYAAIAASAPHAQHMPSHIFTRLGYWQNSIASNLASAAAAGKDMRPRLHAWDYLVYAYLQNGQEAEARSIVELVRAITKLENENFAAAFALAAIPARYALERGRWAEAAELPLAPDEFSFGWARFPHAEAVNAYARAIGAARSGDARKARAEIERLQKLRKAMAAAKQPYWEGQAGIQIAAAEAWVAWAKGDRLGAVKQMRAAANKEDATEKSAITPGPLAPAREMLGEMLIEFGQPAEAREAFKAAQLREPNRRRSVEGARRATGESGDKATTSNRETMRAVAAAR
jgi:hypothetical protein